MYLFEEKQFDSASAALDKYIQQWEQNNGYITTPNFTVQDNRDIKKAVYTIWNSLGVQEVGEGYQFIKKSKHTTSSLNKDFSPIISKASDFGI